jgi:hypothetical protein
MRSVLRWLALYVAAGLILAIGFGVISEFFIELAREKGWYTNPSDKLDTAMNAFSSFVTQPWFLIVTAALGGLATGVWLDVLLRRADRRRTATRQGAEALLTKARPYVRHVSGRLRYALEVCAGARSAEHFYNKIILQRIDMRNVLEADTSYLTNAQKEALEALHIEYAELDHMVTYGEANSANLNYDHIANLYRLRAQKLANALNRLVIALSDGIIQANELVPDMSTPLPDLTRLSNRQSNVYRDTNR